eukprot:TRINITY_DN11926_c0_g1_i1.p1 TRINITY_DN11926_c0_g1~~TRINITY_DN11926_c0_g1_i1.p1  ORF type:complete len:285 (+),score=26.76 TRINITY_DN11926_c0_g1_i1:104-958(+)
MSFLMLAMCDHSRHILFSKKSPTLEDVRFEVMASLAGTTYTTALYLKDHGLKHPFVISSATGLQEELRLAGITNYLSTVNDDGTVAKDFESPLLMGASPEINEIIEANPDVDCVVVGWDMALTARKVATAINYIRWHSDLHSGDEDFIPMPIIACSGDSGGVLGTVPHKGQNVKLRAIGNGAMADIIARSFDPPLEWLDMGKPSDALLGLLRDPENYDVDMTKALMVGDTLQTDIVFGNRGGMKTLLVMSGVTTEKELSACASWNPMRRPTYVLPSLGAALDLE